MLGSISGSVIRRVMVSSPAPEIRADSSSVGSIRSSAPGDLDEDEGEEVHALHGDDARQAVDVEERLLRAEEAHEATC